MNEGVLVGVWANLLFEGLAHGGVTDVVVSPGSRSTPFVVAASRLARLRLHDAIDERTAAFFALGMVRATGRPVALLCTSGTAPAHYFPAILEASESGLPLVVVTADRPLELQQCGAPQTIDQVKLFGSSVRFFADLGLPDPTEGALRGLFRTAIQAVSRSQWPDAGPVHLDARARKPLEPAAPDDEVGHAFVARATRIAERAPHFSTPSVRASDTDVGALAARLSLSKKPLILCGPVARTSSELARSVAQLAARLGAPVAADPASGLRYGRAQELFALDAFDALLRAPASDALLDFDLVLHVGAAPTSSGFERWLRAHPACERWVAAERGWPDPWSSCAGMVFGAPADTLSRVSDALAITSVDRDFTERARGLEHRAWSAVESELANAGDALTEGGVARAAVHALSSLGSPAQLVVGNSLPIRMLDTFARGRASAVRVLSQRGANGIDGLVSGAVGSARGASRPTLLLVGDVSALHDLGGLALARGSSTPLVVLIVNNDGGRIFEQLPVARAVPEALSHFTTPHGLGFEQAAALFGVPYARPNGLSALGAALADALHRPCATVVECVVPPSGAEAQNRRVWTAIERLLGELGSHR